MIELPLTYTAYIRSEHTQRQVLRQRLPTLLDSLAVFSVNKYTYRYLYHLGSHNLYSVMQHLRGVFLPTQPGES